MSDRIEGLEKHICTSKVIQNDTAAGDRTPLTIEMQEGSGSVRSPEPNKKGICSDTLFFAERVEWDEDVLRRPSEE